MSKISKKLIEIPQKVEIEISGQKIRVKGPLGELEYNFPLIIKIIKKEDKPGYAGQRYAGGFGKARALRQGESLRVEIEDIGDKFQKAMQGTTIRLIENMIRGVTNFFEKRLQLIGVGFNAKVETKPRSELGSTTGGENLVLNIGFSHLVNFSIPKGIKIEVEKNNLVVVKGIDKQLVGKIAAEIRQLRKPDVYRGKGIKYEDEEIRKKAVKKMVATTS